MIRDVPTKTDLVEAVTMLQEQLTKKQQVIFDFIRSRIEQEGYGPTIREIADEMGFSSPNGVICHLTALEKKGLIHRSSHKSRSIVLTEEVHEEIRGLPLAGRVAAGGLMEAFEQHERVDLGELWTRKGTYVLEVSGDSMIDAHIQDGDYVVVQNKRTASKGDITVVRNSEGEATLKYWYPEKNRIRLQPANKRLKPIYTRDVKVVGVVVGVVRPTV
ncbi:MAG: transcriptional repressor LexA [Mariniblastus sp.]|nr:transcriptional repressor LexA [Mariniblastus sp.]